MINVNAIPSFILIIVGVVFIVSSLKLGIGNIGSPGPGFVPLGAGGLLIILTLGTIVETFFKRERKSRPKILEGSQWWVMLSVPLSLLVYALLLDIMGFIPCTFLILVFLFKIWGRQSWKVVLGASMLITGFTYLLFSYFLKINFPIGLFEF